VRVDICFSAPERAIVTPKHGGACISRTHASKPQRTQYRTRRTRCVADQAAGLRSRAARRRPRGIHQTTPAQDKATSRERRTRGERIPMIRDHLRLHRDEHLHECRPVTICDYSERRIALRAFCRACRATGSIKSSRRLAQFRHCPRCRVFRGRLGLLKPDPARSPVVSVARWAVSPPRVSAIGVWRLVSDAIDSVLFD
jgi:hypothetical protein